MTTVQVMLTSTENGTQGFTVPQNLMMKLFIVVALRHINTAAREEAKPYKATQITLQDISSSMSHLWRNQNLSF